MNYRHIYHAGNRCDVVKHAILACVVERLKKKPRGFCVLDTHAGCGDYDLSDPRAQRTQEASAGIGALLANSAAREVQALGPFLSVVRQAGPLRYPGSPWLVRSLLRAQDRLVACELHEQDAQTLARLFHGDPKAQIHCRDGYGALKAFLPFPEKRGLVLMDPPFERTDEIDNLLSALRLAHARMSGASVAVWYPIKDRSFVWNFHERAAGLGIPDMSCAEFIWDETAPPGTLVGSGLLFVNAPFGLSDDAQEIFAALRLAFACPAASGRFSPLALSS